MKRISLKKFANVSTIVIFFSLFMGKGTVVLQSDCNCDDPIFIGFLKTNCIEDEKHDKRFPVRNVDRSDLLLFTQSTPQTELSPEVIKKLNGLFPGDNTIEKIEKVYHWVRENFERYHARGKNVAKQSAQQIYDGRKLSGCNDWGLLITSILRSLDFPVVFMNAASINWAKKYRENPSGSGFSGHVFLEVYIEGRWVLIDSTSGQYIEDYDYDDPVLHVQKGGGYFVYQKGLDHWTMGIKSIQDNIEIMKDFALNYPLETISIQNKDIKSLFPSRRK